MARFRIIRLEERIAPSSLCGCRGGSKGGGSKHGGGSKCAGGSHHGGSHHGGSHHGGSGFRGGSNGGCGCNVPKC